MPVLPYAISGICYDVDGSTLMTSGTCKIYNVTQATTCEGNIASDGSFAVDISVNTYAVADKLQIVLFDTNKFKSTEFRHTVAIQQGYDVGSVYMHWTKPSLEEARLHAVVMSNKSAGALTVDFYDRYNDAKILSCDVYITSSFSPNLAFQGLIFKGGICVIRESDAANTVEVTMVVK